MERRDGGTQFDLETKRKTERDGQKGWQTLRDKVRDGHRPQLELLMFN